MVEGANYIAVVEGGLHSPALQAIVPDILREGVKIRGIHPDTGHQVMFLQYKSGYYFDGGPMEPACSNNRVLFSRSFIYEDTKPNRKRVREILKLQKTIHKIENEIRKHRRLATHHSLNVTYQMAAKQRDDLVTRMQVA